MSVRCRPQTPSPTSSQRHPRAVQGRRRPVAPRAMARDTARAARVRWQRQRGRRRKGPRLRRALRRRERSQVWPPVPRPSRRQVALKVGCRRTLSPTSGPKSAAPLRGRCSRSSSSSSSQRHCSPEGGGDGGRLGVRAEMPVRPIRPTSTPVPGSDGASTVPTRASVRPSRVRHEMSPTNYLTVAEEFT